MPMVPARTPPPSIISSIILTTTQQPCLPGLLSRLRTWNLSKRLSSLWTMTCRRCQDTQHQHACWLLYISMGREYSLMVAVLLTHFPEKAAELIAYQATIVWAERTTIIPGGSFRTASLGVRCRLVRVRHGSQAVQRGLYEQGLVHCCQVFILPAG